MIKKFIAISSILLLTALSGCTAKEVNENIKNKAVNANLTTDNNTSKGEKNVDKMEEDVLESTDEGKKTIPKGWVLYTDEKFKYKVIYPEGWTAEDLYGNPQEPVAKRFYTGLQPDGDPNYAFTKNDHVLFLFVTEITAMLQNGTTQETRVYDKLSIADDFADWCTKRSNLSYCLDTNFNESNKEVNLNYLKTAIEYFELLD